jgi:hypothetical protein
MIGSRLRRLRAMDSAELAFRARAALRAHAQRLTARAAPPRWRRGDILRVLAPHVIDRPLRDAVARRAWDDVHAGLQHGLRSRPSRFVIDAETGASLRDAVIERWPSAAADAAARADRIVEGEYDVLGYRRLRYAREDGGLDWHFDPVSRRTAPRAFWLDVPFLDAAVGDHKVIWEVNRHQHWLALGRALWLTGNRRYRVEILDQLGWWLAENPPLVGINWTSMLELAFRSISWVSALHLLLAEPRGIATAAAEEDDARDSPWLVDMLVAIDAQLVHVEQNLSYYFSPNTHLLGEALALYVVGHALPELRRATQWIDTGRRILLTEIDRQIEADGGCSERSTYYHRYTLDFYLLALLAAERCGDDEGAAAFREAVGRLATFMRHLADDAGRIPQIGDDDGGQLWPIAGRDPLDVRDSLSLAAVALDEAHLAPWGVCEETLWLGWSAHRERLTRPGSPLARVPSEADAPPAAPSIAVFRDTGYLVLRDGAGSHLVFDAGPHGFLNGGHAHADALSITLSVGGRRLLIDPGTCSYTADRVARDRMRRTANHNTVTLNGRCSSLPAGPFHWQTHADGQLAGCGGSGTFAWAEGFHDGYPGLRHRRMVMQSPDASWLVLDDVRGDGLTDAELHWHFDPLWSVAARSGRVLLARHAEGDACWVVHDGGEASLVHGDDASGLGWCSPRYGTLVPTWTARVSRRARAPLTLVSWIGRADDDEPPPMLDVLPSDDAASVVARLRRRASLSMAMFRPGDRSEPFTRGASVGEYRTDARLLHYSVAGDRQLTLAVADCTEAAATDERFISVAAESPIADLDLAIRQDRLDIRSSVPPAGIRLSGRTLSGVRRLRLNGRDVPLNGSADGALVVAAADWPDLASDARVDTCVA